MSGTIAFPPNPTTGQTYQFGGATWVWNGSVWTIAGSSNSFIVVGPNAPSATNVGQLWWNTNDGQLYIWTGTAWTVTVNPPIPALSAVPQNYIDNSGFTVNQRAYVSGTALIAGAYGFDRWKGGVSGCTLTFTASPASTLVDITAGSLQQVVEGLNLLSAPYTLSWTGSATGRISNSSGAGTYAASPVEFTATADTNAFVEFTGGTVSQVQLQLGTVATPWQPQPAAVELQRCTRFAQSIPGLVIVGSFPGTGNYSWSSFTLPGQMRAAPTVQGSNQSVTGGSSGVVTWNSSPNLMRPTVAIGQANTVFTISIDVFLTADL